MTQDHASSRGFATAVARATLLVCVVAASCLAGQASQRQGRCESASDVELLEAETIVSEGVGRRHCRGQRATAFLPAPSVCPARLAQALNARPADANDHSQRNGVGGPLRC